MPFDPHRTPLSHARGPLVATLFFAGIGCASLDGLASGTGPVEISWMIGYPDCPCSAFVGVLDEVAIYSTPLSADRILAHYRAGTGG